MNNEVIVQVDRWMNEKVDKWMNKELKDLIAILHKVDFVRFSDR